MDGDTVVPIVMLGAISAIILLPIYWRLQMRRRVLEAVRDMANSSAPMSADLVASLMAPLPQSLPSRIRDLRRGYVLIAVAIGFAIVGLAAYVIATTSGGSHEAPGVAAGIAAIGAIPGCIGIAFILLGLSQKNEA